MDHYHLDGNPRLGFSEDYMDKIYSKPYTRIPPYLVGMAIAFFFADTGVGLKQRIKKYWWYILYLFSAAIVILPIFLTHVHQNWTEIESILYTVLSRTSVALGVALLMYSCFMRPKSWLNLFFSSSAWTAMARLTFAAYLIHPVILFTFYLDRSRLMHYQNTDLIFYFISTAVISYALALITAMLVEKPAMNLEKLLLPSRRK